jgi:hypothetical protein
MKSYLNDIYQRVLTKDIYSKNYLSNWKKNKLEVRQGSILDQLHFLLYINDLPGSINNLSKPALFVSYTNIIFTHPNLTVLKEGINIVFEKIIKWFQINSLSLNSNKTYYMHFMPKINYAVNVDINYQINQTSKVSYTNFLGLTLDSALSWKPHIDQLITKLNSACYVIRSLKSIMSLENLRMIYFSNVHSILSYGIIFWGYSSYANTVFKIQKRVRRLMMNVGSRESCREFFKKLNILPLHSQYILSLLLFVVKNINMFKSNSMVHTIDTRHSSDLHLPSTHLSKLQKGMYHSGIRAFNCLPPRI